MQKKRLSWISDLQTTGHVLMSGPSTDRSTSILLLDVPSYASAQQLVESDPLRERWSSVEILSWEIHFDNRIPRILP